jgi:hypothetical protein
VDALIDHGSEINLMSTEFYKKEKWSINTNHGWKIRAATKAMKNLYGAHRVWWIGWRQRFGQNRWLWWIGRSPCFQEHAASMADREASVVRVEQVVLLEVENEVEHDDEDGEDSGNAGSR